MTELDKKTLEYRNYIEEHIENVSKASAYYNRIIIFTLGISKEEELSLLFNITVHDASKYSVAELEGYRQYYYPVQGATKDEHELNKAWLHHIHKNPHHPEYWVLVDGADLSKSVVLDMPRIYIAEMIFDWIAMGYKFNNKVYDWYKENKNKIPLSEITRNLVEQCMAVLKDYDEKREGMER